jgi:hypothetical protein
VPARPACNDRAGQSRGATAGAAGRA